MMKEPEEAVDAWNDAHRLPADEKTREEVLDFLRAFAVAWPKGSRSITPSTVATPNRQIFQNFLGLDDWKT
jgi:hypothetical protein